MKATHISKVQYEQLIKDATLIHQGPFGPKVFLTKTNQTLKIFYQEQSFKRKFFPNSIRFIKLTNKLLKRGIHTVHPSHFYRCSELHLDVVIYPWLEGTSLRDQVQQGDYSNLPRYAAFVASLHAKHIYFRGAHIGNILVDQDHPFALIDVCNLRFGINLRRRIKNILYIMNHWIDKDHFIQYGCEKFINDYLDATTLSASHKEKVLNALSLMSF